MTADTLGASPEDKNVEQVLFDRLMQGCTLMEQCCPNCSTPLVKAEDDAQLSPSNSGLEIKASDSNLSVEEEWTPVGGIPFCVACEAHVATNETELLRATALIASSPKKKKGSLLVALSDEETHTEIATESASNSTTLMEINFGESILNVQDASGKTLGEKCSTDEPGEQTSESPSNKDINSKENVERYEQEITSVGNVSKVEPDDVVSFPVIKVDGAASPPVAETHEEAMKCLSPLVAAAQEVEIKEEAKKFFQPLVTAAQEVATQEQARKCFEPLIAAVDDVASKEKAEQCLKPLLTAAQDVVTQEEAKKCLKPLVIAAQEGLKTVQNIVSPTCTGIQNGEVGETYDFIEAEDSNDNVIRKGGQISESSSDPDDVLSDKDLMPEYNVRRDIATKVLGAKMLQGYSLKESPCEKCGMPVMEYKGKIECVVCPVLVKKAKNALKEKREAQGRQKDEEEKRRKAEEQSLKDEEEKRRKAEEQALKDEEENRRKAEEQALKEEEEKRTAKIREAAVAKMKQKQEEAAQMKAEIEAFEETRRIEILREQEIKFRIEEQCRLDLLREKEERMKGEERALEILREREIRSEEDRKNKDARRLQMFLDYEAKSKLEEKSNQEEDPWKEEDDAKAAERRLEMLLEEEAKLRRKEENEKEEERKQEDERVLKMMLEQDAKEREKEEQRIAEEELIREEERRKEEEEKEAEINKLVAEMRVSQETRAAAQEHSRKLEEDLRKREERKIFLEAEEGIKAAEQAALEAEQKAVELSRLAEEALNTESAEQEVKTSAQIDAKVRAEEEERINEWLKEESRLIAQAKTAEDLVKRRAEENALSKAREDEERTQLEIERMRAAEEAFRKEEEAEWNRQREEESRKARKEEEEKQDMQEAEEREAENRKTTEEAVKEALRAAKETLKGDAALMKKLEEEYSSNVEIRNNPLELSCAPPLTACIPVKSPLSEIQNVREDDATRIEQLKHWATLRRDGRAQLSRRMLNGWSMTGKYCTGSHCGSSPLMFYRGGPAECVVCGGSGDGTDGAYALPISPRKSPQKNSMGVAKLTEKIIIQPEDVFLTPVAVADPAGDLRHVVAPSDLANEKSLRDTPQDVASLLVQKPTSGSPAQKTKASREIGRRMLAGWTLLDAACPKCATPLMAETKNGPKECVGCGFSDFRLGSYVTTGKEATGKVEQQKPLIEKHLSAAVAREGGDETRDGPENDENDFPEEIDQDKENPTDDLASVGGGSQVLIIPENFDYSDEAAMKEIFAEAKVRQEKAKRKEMIPPKSIVVHNNTRRSQSSVVAYVTDMQQDREFLSDDWKPPLPVKPGRDAKIGAKSDNFSQIMSAEQSQKQNDLATVSTKVDTWDDDNYALLSAPTGDSKKGSREDEEPVVSPDWITSQKNSLKMWKEQLSHRRSLSMDEQSVSGASCGAISQKEQFTDSEKNIWSERSISARSLPADAAGVLKSTRELINSKLQAIGQRAPEDSTFKLNFNENRTKPLKQYTIHGGPMSLQDTESKIQSNFDTEDMKPADTDNPFDWKQKSKRRSWSLDVAGEKRAGEELNLSSDKEVPQDSESIISAGSQRSKQFDRLHVRSNSLSRMGSTSEPRSWMTPPRVRESPRPAPRKSESPAPTWSRSAGPKLPPRPDSFLSSSAQDFSASSPSPFRSFRSLSTPPRGPANSSPKQVRVPTTTTDVGDEDNASVGSEDLSRCGSVATDALGTILEKIEKAKSQLELPKEEADSVNEAISTQMEMAKLIEKLASAAVAVKKLEDM